MGKKKWPLIFPAFFLLVVSRLFNGDGGDNPDSEQPAGYSFSSLGAEADPADLTLETGRAIEPLVFRRPSRTPPRWKLAGGWREIEIRKSSADYKIDFSKPRLSWNYLTKEVRDQIDQAVIEQGRWSRIVLHSSASETGDLEMIDRYHREIRRIDGGLAYHFIIGNGTGSGAGEIQVGDRWIQQSIGPHLKSYTMNSDSIGICLVGDFNRHHVGEEQLEALDEILDYLQAKVGKIEVTTHQRVGSETSTCPGRHFPDHLILDSY